MCSDEQIVTATGILRDGRLDLSRRAVSFINNEVMLLEIAHSNAGAYLALADCRSNLKVDEGLIETNLLGLFRFFQMSRRKRAISMS